eukprot:403347415
MEFKDKTITYKSLLFMAIYEFLGTFIALVCVNCAVNNAAVVGVGFFIAATLTGRVCGGHFNGAVTLAVYLCEARWCENLPIALIIVVVDLMGAYAAMAVCLAMQGVDGTFTLIPPSDHQSSEFSNVFIVMVEEALFTWILVSSILFIKYRKVSATEDGMLSNVTVGLAIYVAVSMSGPITGGGLNPTFGLALISTDILTKAYYPEKTDPVHPPFLVSYTIGPLIGGILAALLLLLTQKITPEAVNPKEDYMQTRHSSVSDINNNYTIQFNKDLSSPREKKTMSGLEVLSAKDYLMGA